MIVAVGFPNPIGWAIDKVTGFIGGVATAGFEMIIGGLVAWVIDAVVWVVGGVFNFFLDSANPNVQADWFVTGTGPYATTATIGATLLVLFVLAGIVQGTLAGDVGGMLRRMALDLPMSVLGMVGLVTFTQALIRLTDVLSTQVLGSFEDDIAEFTSVILSLSRLTGATSTAFVVFLLGLVTVLAGITLVAELVIRAALIYIVVALAPLVFACRLWPATRGAARKLLELLCALILSKLVIAVALAVAAAAAVGTGSGGEVTALPAPEVFAEDPGGSVTQAVGILLAAGAAFGVAAFSPLLIAKLLPLTESAVVAQGIRSGPARAGQQGLAMANTAQAFGRHRLTQIASARPALGPAAGAGAGAGVGGPAGLAAAGPAGAVHAAGRAVSTGTAAVNQPPTPQPSTAPDRPTAQRGPGRPDPASGDRPPGGPSREPGPSRRQDDTGGD